MATIRRRRAAPARTPAKRSEPDFSRLPERVDPADMVTTQEVTPARDPEGGRDTERDFMFRNMGI